jgi:V-type H+-transporting ATPase subunit D
LVELASLQVRSAESLGTCCRAKHTPTRSLTDRRMCAHEQTAFTILDEVIKATNRRVNAIEHVVIPRLENTVSYINSELDEMDRWVATGSL